MKRNIVLYFLLTYLFVLNGCVVQSNSSGSNDDAKGKLFQIEGGLVCQELKTNKMWQFNKEGPFDSWEEADRYATELKLGGHDDWRLPTRSELFDLFYTHYWKNDGNCMMTHKSEFWVISKGRESSLGHWEDDFLCGPEFNFVEAIREYGFVRAIRP